MEICFFLMLAENDKQLTKNPYEIIRMKMSEKKITDFQNFVEIHRVRWCQEIFTLDVMDIFSAISTRHSRKGLRGKNSHTDTRPVELSAFCYKYFPTLWHIVYSLLSWHCTTAASLAEAQWECTHSLSLSIKQQPLEKAKLNKFCTKL